MNKRDREKFRKMLIEQREQLVGNARRAVSGDIHVDPDDFPDEIDTASSEVNLQFTGRLREREQGLLGKIEHALARTQELVALLHFLQLVRRAGAETLALGALMKRILALIRQEGDAPRRCSREAPACG